jgi:hypothetical protein
METAAQLGPRLVPEPADGALDSSPEVGRTLKAVAVYQLSEAGRKASLLAGGNGRMTQNVKVDVPVSRLHLVQVDEQGSACLKLRPKYVVDATERIACIDSIPLFDKPPSIDELFHEAARNHQLERAYVSQRTLARELERDKRLRLARAFLDDPSQRALLHPPPEPRLCYLGGPDRHKVRFDGRRVEGIDRDVSVEAFRRFRADVRSADARKERLRLESQGNYEKKKVQIIEWLKEHGTSEQLDQFMAGTLPMHLVIADVAEVTFGALRGLAIFSRNGLEILQSQLRAMPQYARTVVNECDLTIRTRPAGHPTEAAAVLTHRVKSQVPGAQTQVLLREFSWKRDRAVKASLQTVVVTRKLGALLLRREYSCEMIPRSSDS